MTDIPERGQIVWTDFDPVIGHEQAKHRPALVLSVGDFNRKSRMVLVAPITNRVRGHAFEVPLEGTKTQGVILCHQMRSIDYRGRGFKFIEQAPTPTVGAALDVAQEILS